jgi:hypothetical protein
MTAIVMTACAKMPNSCWGRYRRVVVVDVEYWRAWHRKDHPKMISTHAKGVLRIVRDLGKHNEGKTAACAYERALVEAQKIADAYNNSRDVAEAEQLISTGSA